MSATVVKFVLIENGVTVNYSVKTYETAIADAVKNARAGAERLLAQATAAS